MVSVLVCLCVGKGQCVMGVFACDGVCVCVGKCKCVGEFVYVYVWKGIVFVYVCVHVCGKVCVSVRM